MAKKRKSDNSADKPKIKIGSKKDKSEAKRAKREAAAAADSDGAGGDSDDEISLASGGAHPPEMELPSKEILNRLLDRIEAQLPKDDHVKYDSRARKLDWKKIEWEECAADDCRKLWFHIQDKIRRFRILHELIPDARTWVAHPWTNFYKSKDHNRHPDMPKKPLSMYMLFYSEMREEILKTDPSMSMPEVAKACSEKYQKLSDKKKNRYKQRCDEMRKEYEAKMEEFYRNHPDLKPVKGEKGKNKSASSANSMLQQQQQQQQQMMMNNRGLMTSPKGPPTAAAAAAMPQFAQLNQPQPPQTVVATMTAPAQMAAAPIQMEVALPTQHYQQQPPQQQMVNIKPEEFAGLQPQQVVNAYPNAPERPPKPFELYFKSVVDDHMNDPGFDRQSTAEKCRNEWKNMKVKKKAKWIRRAADAFREYELRVEEFTEQNPGYIPPHDKKNFLTQEDQKILDKHMGRPEKPPSSAYSLFSKEMLNHPEIKKFPSKERMSHISEQWKHIDQGRKDAYQAQVNESMTIYRQQYEEWFDGLNEEERKAETARMNTSKSKPKNAQAAQNAALKKQQQQQQQQLQQQLQQQQQHQQQQQQQLMFQQQQQPQAIPIYSIHPVPQQGQQMQPQQIIQIQQPPQMQTIQPQIQLQPQLPQQPQPPPQAMRRDVNALRAAILKREPVEPPRSPKQLYISEYLSKSRKKKNTPADAKEAWKALDKKDKKKWAEKLEPQRQKYIEAYTVFVRGLDKEELELYTELKRKRDEEEEEAKRQNDSSDSDDSDSSESESESAESESESD